MMNSRWQANKIGLINFWYYDEQEFPFVKGRILLRGSNGSGKSVTMQSVVPLLLDGNMSPERLDPFGSRDRKMSSYLLEEDDGREERTGYLYLEFKRQDTDTYLTIGMGIRARRGKNLDKWYFSLTDGRRVGKDFYLYKETGEKVTLSKKELENRIGTGGRVIDRQADYMEYVNRQIFGFETVEEYKEMVDLLIQLRTPKLSKDFKPSVINDILSDSLQPLSDDDLRPMSEAIENMDTMNMNLKNRKEAKQAAEKIQAVFSKYNQKLLYEKADRYEQAEIKLENAKTQQKEQEKKLSECRQNIEKLQAEHQELDARHASMEKERESLNKSDAVALKRREAELTTELEGQQKNLREKQHFLELKQDQYQDAQNQIKAEEDRKYEKEKELKELIEEMQDEADTMAFEEHAFMKEELEKHPEEPYKFELHQQQFDHTKEKINKGTEILAETDRLERQKDDLIKEREKKIRELDTLQRKVSELEAVFVQTQNEWKEALYQWNGANRELVLEKELLRELSTFAESYEETSDFAEVRQKIADVWIAKNADIESGLSANKAEKETTERELEEVKAEMLDEALLFVKRNMRTKTIISPTTGRRTDRTDYPITAVREAIINALVHRDYSIHTEGMPIQLIMFEDRIEIHNPGGLYGRITIDQLGKIQPDTRNPVLASALETLGITENRYSGIPTIRMEMEKYNLRQPEFLDERGSFIVKLYKESKNDYEDMSNDEETNNLIVFCKTPRTRKEICDYLGLNSVTYAIQTYVNPLVEAGVIKLSIPDKPKSPKQLYYSVEREE